MKPTIDASDFIQIEAVIRLKIGEIIVLGRRPSAWVCHCTLRRQIFKYFVSHRINPRTIDSSCEHNTDMSNAILKILNDRMIIMWPIQARLQIGRCCVIARDTKLVKSTPPAFY